MTRTVPRDPRYDILFEPVKIGPVVAKNRFFQVPHCNGMGHAKPRSHAAMRAVKAEGGWAVVSTEEVEIHPSSDLSPYVEGRLWDDSDIPFLELMTRAVHQHGALTAIELVHAGMNAANLYSREVSIAPSHITTAANYSPAQAREAPLLQPSTRDIATRVNSIGRKAMPSDSLVDFPIIDWRGIL